MKTKKILIILSTLLLAVVFINNKSYAVLQSNGGTVATKDIGTWMTQIRNMEAIGGSLGLEETIAGNLLTNGDTNNLDCHMEKNTEYGAMAILSASSYGNPEKIENGGTTTGNNSGVVININKEWTAAGILSACSQYANASARYKNTYSQGSGYSVTYAKKNGDAITETSGWHGSGASTWISSAAHRYPNFKETAKDAAGLLRAYSGSIFSYYGYSQYYDSTNDLGYSQAMKDAHNTKAWASRAVIVIGEGF